MQLTEGVREADLLHGLFSSISLKAGAVKFRVCVSVCGLLLILHVSLKIWCKLSPWDQRFHVVQKSIGSSTMDMSGC